jgi:hypothetical protein
MNAGLSEVLSAYSRRDFGKLRSLGGLPEGLAPAEVAAALGADPEAYVRWFLGDPPEEAFWCPATVDGYDGAVKIWFRDGVVVKLEGEWPELSPAEAEVLGPPEMRLDYQLDVMVVPGGEQVWASLGLALKLNSEGSLAVGLSAFPPTTPSGYREALQTFHEYRESPLPEEDEFS